MIAKQGHNSVAGQQLKAFIDRIERLVEEKKALQEDITALYAEAKGNGYDTKALRALISLRAKDRAELAEHNATVRLYADALGDSWDPFD